jgi:hypothetical protein
MCVVTCSRCVFYDYCGEGEDLPGRYENRVNSQAQFSSDSSRATVLG